MNKTKSIKKNYIYNLLYQILVIILPLITTPYLSRVLGAEAIGIYSYTVSITTYFIMFGSLGAALYGQREIAFCQDDKEKRSKKFYEIFLMRFISLGISILIFYFLFGLKGEYNIYYRILLLEIFANSIDISWFFQGLEEFNKTVLRIAIVKIISLICIFVFIKDTEDLYLYFIIYVLSTLLGNISLWIYLPKYLKKIKLKEIKIFEHIKPTILLFIPQIAIQIYTVIDKTMIGTIVADKAEVGFYEQSQKIIKLLTTIATSLGTVMIPRMANTFAKGDNKKLNEYIYKSFQFVLMLVFPLIFGCISIIYKFVPLFYGPGYDKTADLIIIIIPVILAIGMSNVIGTQYLMPTKQTKKLIISVTIAAIINFILNCILINLYQSIGASIATVIAEFTVIIIQFYLVRKEINFIQVLKICKKYFVSSIFMFLVSLLIGHVIDSNIISIILQIISSIIVYFISLILLKDELVLNGLEIFKKKIKNIYK